MKDRDGTEHVPAGSRDAKKNLRTQFDGRTTFLSSGHYQELFLGHYQAFAPVCRKIDAPGLAIVAIDFERGKLEGLLTLAGRADRPVGAIIGRHSFCDLSLEHELFSLRHLAVLLEPPRSFAAGRVELAYRVLDLRTKSPLHDEWGEELASVRAEGPAFFRSGPYAFLFLAVGDPSDWPDDGAQAWSFVPGRTYFDERPGRAPPPVPPPPKNLRHSMITRLPGPGGLLPSAATTAVATLELSTGSRRVTVPLDAKALHEGVLLGRYDRCDAASILDDSSVSRVHLLIVRVGAQVAALDTGSSYGTFLDGRRIGGITLLRNDTSLVLGETTALRWRLR